MMHRLQCYLHCLLLLLTAFYIDGSIDHVDHMHTSLRNRREQSTFELPRPLLLKEYDDNELEDFSSDTRTGRSYRPTIMDMALQASVREGIEAMAELYGRIEPQILRNGQLLAENHPAAMLSKFSAPTENTTTREMAAYAAITATKAFKRNFKQIDDLARQAHNPKISLRRTALEGLCPPRDPPICTPASQRYRTHDGTCNNHRRLRWGAAQMPFNRFLPPEYGDGVDTIRNGVNNEPLSSSRFVSLLVHGAKDGEAPLTLMTAQWGQLLDHDMTSTAQPRSINGSVPSCCGGKDFHPSCFPIKVPQDDPWLAPLKVRCLEFLRSAPAQRRDCVLSWREQTNQATSFIDASPIYSSSSKSSDNARAFRKGLLIFGRGNPAEDVCQRGALARQCIRSGDGRSGEQPGLLALHQVWVGEHNRIATELSELNLHWSDEKVYQETRRIVGAMFQHITYREFLPIILGREVCKLFELDLQTTGYYDGYDPKTNPTVANSFAAAAFRFGHSLIQDSYIRCDRHHNRINNSVNLHEEFQRGDIGSAGSLHRLIRGLATQRALKRDEFISPELTNHLFQTPGFPFGLDLAAINIQRGRDHGIAPYTTWRAPCGLSPINNWNDFANIVGPESAQRIAHAYRSVHDIDLFVGGIAERPVVGGLVGPTFACIIAQQFSNSRKGDRFWYENRGFESSFTPAQLHSIRRVSLAQVLCRSVGGGTFQPNIFIPHVFPGNERLPCGIGPLASIDLSPWLEQDPFIAPPSLSEPTMETTEPDRVFDIISDVNSLTETQQMKEENIGAFNKLMGPFANVSSPQKQEIVQPAMVLQRPLNASKINDKLDIKRKTISTKRPTPKPIKGVNNKLDHTQSSNFNVKSVNGIAGRPQTTTKRTIVINNIPIELRTTVTNDNTNINSNKKTTSKPTSTPTKTTNDKKKKKKKNKNNAKINNKVQARAGSVNGKLSDINAFKDQIVFDEAIISKVPRENTEPTNMITVLGLKTIINEKPSEKFLTHQNANNDNLLNRKELETLGPEKILISTNQTTPKDFLLFDETNILATSTNTPDQIKAHMTRMTVDEELNILTTNKPPRKTEEENQTEIANSSMTDITQNSSVESDDQILSTNSNDEENIASKSISNKTNSNDNLQETHTPHMTLQFEYNELTSKTNETDKLQLINTTKDVAKIQNPKGSHKHTTETIETNETDGNFLPIYTIIPNNDTTEKAELTNLSENYHEEKSTDKSEPNDELNEEPKVTNITENSRQDDHEITNQDKKIEQSEDKQTEKSTLKHNTENNMDNQTQHQENNENSITELDLKELKLTSTTNSSSTQSTFSKDQSSKLTSEQLNRDADIDPLTHTTETEHKRVQRKINYSKTRTELRDLTYPKLLRLDRTMIDTIVPKHDTTEKANQSKSIDELKNKPKINNVTKNSRQDDHEITNLDKQIKLIRTYSSSTQYTKDQTSKNTSEQLNRDTGIDPLSYTTETEHIRVQRKVNFSKLKTELGNVINQKQLRVSTKDTILPNKDTSENSELTNSYENNNEEKLTDQSESKDKLNDEVKITNITENVRQDDYEITNLDKKVEHRELKQTKTITPKHNTEHNFDNQTQHQDNNETFKTELDFEEVNFLNEITNLNKQIEPTEHKQTETNTPNHHTENNLHGQIKRHENNETFKTEFDFRELNLTQATTLSSTQYTKDQTSKLSSEQLNRDADIDPLSYATETELKRVQRKVNFSKLKTELRNVTSPKQLRVNVATKDTILPENCTTERSELTSTYENIHEEKLIDQSQSKEKLIDKPKITNITENLRQDDYKILVMNKDKKVEQSEHKQTEKITPKHNTENSSDNQTEDHENNETELDYKELNLTPTTNSASTQSTVSKDQLLPTYTNTFDQMDALTDGKLNILTNEEPLRKTEEDTKKKTVDSSMKNIPQHNSDGTTKEREQNLTTNSNDEESTENNPILNKTNSNNTLQENQIPHMTLQFQYNKQTSKTNESDKLQLIYIKKDITKIQNPKRNCKHTSETIKTKETDGNFEPIDTIIPNNDSTEKSKLKTSSEYNQNKKLTDQPRCKYELKDEPKTTNIKEDGYSKQGGYKITNLDNKIEQSKHTHTETSTPIQNTENMFDNQTQNQTSNRTLTTELKLKELSLTQTTNSSSTQSTISKNQTSKLTTGQLDRDVNIDPLAYITDTDHKRAQRKVNYSKLKTESRNVTNPKLLRVNITNQNVKLVTTFKLYSLKNRTVTTTKLPKVTKISRTTENSVELRQYQTRPIYTRPHKVVLDGPNSDQYEIEINIRQTNKSPIMKATLSYADQTTAYRPFGYDRYSNYADYQSTTPPYGFYQSEPTIASNFVQPKRTRPPTVIYLDEHDDRTTTKQPSILQNFLSFAASGFGVNRRPTPPSNAQKEKEKPVFSQNTLTNGGLTSTLVSNPHNSAPSSQFGPEPPRQTISSSFSQVGSYPVNNGVVHAASGAVSNGNFGAIMGIASANGADSIFSFNIRPRPPAHGSSASISNPIAGSYGLVQSQRPDYTQFQRPDYSNLPIASYPNAQFSAQQNSEVAHSPFSTTGNKQPQQQYYFSRYATDSQEKTHIATNDDLEATHHKIDIHDFDYLSKTAQSNVNENGNNDANEDNENENDDLDNEYAYDDIDETNDDIASKKFNRDGYIRPEFMIETILKSQDIPITNVTNTNNSKYMLDDNFVLPVLNSSKTMTLYLPKPMAIRIEDNNLTKTTANPTDSIPKHLNKDIFAEDYDDEFFTRTQASNAKSRLKLVHKQMQNASLLPITVLTKPERPDNWVIYDTPVEKPLLPEIPVIRADTSPASEVPVPFSDLTNIWLAKFIKNNKPRNSGNTKLPITMDDSTNKTLKDIKQDNTTVTAHFNNLTSTRQGEEHKSTTIQTFDTIKTENSKLNRD